MNQTTSKHIRLRTILYALPVVLLIGLIIRGFSLLGVFKSNEQTTETSSCTVSESVFLNNGKDTTKLYAVKMMIPAIEETTPTPTSTPTPTATPTPTPEPTPVVNPPMEEHITRVGGVFNGPSGRETYYNLNMSGVISLMRELGYSEEEYPYWIRDDGCKMFGDYVMVAANLSIRPKGTILETSMGTAIVVDTGDFVNTYPEGIDIAVNW